MGKNDVKTDLWRKHGKTMEKSCENQVILAKTWEKYGEHVEAPGPISVFSEGSFESVDGPSRTPGNREGSRFPTTV